VNSLSEESAETGPAFETGRLSRSSGSGPGAPERLALRPVFPFLRPAVWPGAGAPALLGREAEGRGRLEGNDISRRHGALEQDGGRLILRDLASRNGTFVNGERVVEAALDRHDVVRLGEWVAVVVGETGDEGDPAVAAAEARLHLGPTAGRLALVARRMAATALPIVLEGESGTGKERFATAIHHWSGRKGPFLGINCAAIPVALAEAELFGHREGAFTGAQRASLGHFRAAQGGTLFLDEVTDMPLGVQAKLLRVLEQREVLPVGESRPAAVDVRIIAASQVPLARAVAEQRMRADLQARLEGFVLQIPPLRERREDIPSLFQHLLARHGLPSARLSPRLVEALCYQRWPLNVRELDFLAARLAALHPDQPLLGRAHLPDTLRGRGGPPEARPLQPSHDQLLAAINGAGGNLARAATTLGISRNKVYRLLGAAAPERSKAGRRKPR
jgi:hypothetical protein